MATSEHPHQLLDRYCADRIGRRQDLYGQFSTSLFSPLVHAVSDQLSIYLDQRPFAHFRCRSVALREGQERAYLLAALTNRDAPLRISAAMDGWDIQLRTNEEMELAKLINGRRWRFIDKWMGKFFAPLLEQIADTMLEYYARKPYAVPRAGIIRFIEGVDHTYLCCEVDDRSIADQRDPAHRYRVQ